MGAEVFLVGPDDGDLFHQLSVFRLLRTQQARQVIGVGNGDAAFTGGDRFDLIGIATFGAAGKIAYRSACPFLGLGLAKVGDQRRHQRKIVGVAT